MDRDILNLREELLNEMALVDAKKVSNETLYSINLCKIVKEYHDAYMKRAAEKRISISRYLDNPHRRSLQSLIDNPMFTKGLTDRGISLNTKNYITAAMNRIFGLYIGSLNNINITYEGIYLSKEGANENLIENIVKLLKVNLEYLSSSGKEGIVKEAIEEAIQLFSYTDDPIKKAIDNKNAKQLDSIIMNTKKGVFDTIANSIAEIVDGDIDKFLFAYGVILKNWDNYKFTFYSILIRMSDFVSKYGEKLTIQQTDKLFSYLSLKKEFLFGGENSLATALVTKTHTGKELFFEKYYKNDDIARYVLSPIMYKLMISGELENIKKAVFENKQNLKDFTCIYISSNKENFIKFLRAASKISEVEKYIYHYGDFQEEEAALKKANRFASSLTYDEVKELADMILAKNKSSSRIRGIFAGDSFLSIHKDQHLIALKAIQNLHLVELIKKDKKYAILLSPGLKSFINKEASISALKNDPKKTPVLNDIGTNKKIEIMKNAGIDKSEIDKLKPNTAKTKKEKKFGKGITS